MNRMFRVALSIVGILLGSTAANAQTRPNVLLIVSEDNGAELGCYGDPYAKTPHLDRLADSGCRFTNAYVTQGVCSVSRASILTGLYPFQNGHIGLATHQYAMFRAWDNIPSILKEHGYRTGMIGKLHVNPESAFPLDYRAIPGNGFKDRPMRKYANAAAKFFRETEGPFFLAINFPDAHLPLLKQQHGLPVDPQEAADVKSLPFIGADSPRLRQGVADYYNCLSRLDSGVGMVLEELDKSGKRDNTLIIYLGDHGAQFSRGKLTCYEGGLRIPLLLNWPEFTKPGTICDKLVSTVDILPTVLEAVGLPPRESLPGQSLLPLAEGNESVPWRKYLFAERTAHHAGSFFPQRTFRDERYKIIVNLTPERLNPVAEAYRTHDGAILMYGTTQEEIDASPPAVRQCYQRWRNPPPVELYDLANDPWEFHDLANDLKYSAVKQRLLDELHRFRVEHNDPLLDPKKLDRLAKEHDRVFNELPDGRYKEGQRWEYLDYLQQ